MTVAKHLGGLLFQNVEVQLVAQRLDQRRIREENTFSMIVASFALMSPVRIALRYRRM